MKLAAPVMLAQIGVVAVQLFDNAMVGRLGALPLASVSFGGSVFFLIFIFAHGIAMALTPVVGELYSQGKYRTAAAYFQNSLALFPVIGIAGTLASLGMVLLMPYLGQPPEVVAMAVPYYKWLAWSLIPYMVFSSFRQFLEGVGNTSVNMFIILSANVINIFFNWLFIYGNWGCPAMGAEGAGLGTFISRAWMPLFAVVYFVLRPKFRRYLRYFRRADFSWKKSRLLLTIGYPISAQMAMEGGAFVLTSIMIGWIGTVEIAGNQIATVISNFAFMIVVGIGSATTIRISHEYGRGNLRELKKAGTASYHMTLLWNTFTALLFIIFREQLARIFTDDPAVIKVAGHLLIFVAAFQFSDGLQSISVGILRGLQDVKSVMRIAFVSYILINLPVGYVCAFVFGWGPGGLWVGFIFGLSIAAALLMSRYRKQYALLRRRQIENRRVA